MRFIWMIFAGLLVLMVAVVPRLRHHAPPMTAASPAKPVALATSQSGRVLPLIPAGPAQGDSIAAFGLAQRGTPYVWAGTSPLTGFDCSGFIMYTFAHYGVPVPHSTALLIDVGRPVTRAEAQPGDIVVFTGTAPTSTTAGHAGIVISRRGELPLRFVHASSSRREPFVKVSQVENSDYERRFMQVRRVLGPGTGLVAAARPRPEAAAVPRPARTSSGMPVAALPTRVVTVASPAAAMVPALPQMLALKKITPAGARSHQQAAHHSATRQPVIPSKVKARKSAPKSVSKAALKAKPKAKPKAKISVTPKVTANKLVRKVRKLR